MPKIRPETAARRRTNILEAAYRAFGAHGIDVSVDEICAEAGISKGTFYGYFESKDEAILAIARKHRADIRSLAGIDDAEALANHLLSYGHRGNAATSRFELETWAYSLSNPAVRAIFQSNLDELDRSIAASLQRTKHLGDAPPRVSAEEGALILRIFTAGMMATTAIDDRTEIGKLKPAIHHLVTMVVNAGAAEQGENDPDLP